MKFKISKSLWEETGKKMGWINKEALAAPISPEKARELAELGYYTMPSREREFPKGGIKEHEQILKDTGAGELFGNTPIRFRTHYMPKMKNLVLIDGREYILAHIEKSTKKVDGKIYVFGPVVRKQDGSVDWAATGNSPREFSYNQYAEQVQRSPAVMEGKMDLINKFVDKYNEFVDKQADKKFGTVIILPLQLKWAEDILSKRIKEVEAGQVAAEESEDVKGRQVAKGKEVTEGLREDIVSGRTRVAPADYAVALLETKFHSIPTLQGLLQEIQTIRMPYEVATNNTLKEYLTKVIEWQIRVRQEEAAKKGEEKVQREERKESDLPEMKELLLRKIKKVEGIPGKYDKATGYYSPETAVTQTHEVSEKRGTELEELNAVFSALTHARQTIIDLPKATTEYLRGEGVARMGQLKSFIDNAKIFIKRYKEQVLKPEGEELTINPKLFSKTTGGLGNALIAVILAQIIMSVEGELARITGPAVEQVAVPTEIPTEEPVTSSKKDIIQKMSDILWSKFQEKWNPR
jgi:hypothetical protein